MDINTLKIIVEGALLAAGEPLTLNQLNALFPDDEKPGHGALKEALAALDGELEGRAVELREVGSGYRLQIRSSLMPVIANLWTEKPPRYSRALLETLAIIAYRQPITRGEIEQIRGVSLSGNILRTLQERQWIKVVGHRDVPGRPELLGTSKQFLDYFNLKSLDELPTLAEIKDLDNLEPELQLTHPETFAERATEDKHQHEQTDTEDDNGGPPENHEHAPESDARRDGADDQEAPTEQENPPTEPDSAEPPQDRRD